MLDIFEQAKKLRDEEGFRFLRDICAIDWLGKRSGKRFDVNYVFANFETKESRTLKAQVDDGESLPSLVELFPSAEFMEREVFDLMGMKFENHPDLRRILLSYDWEGYPLRKDYPVSGYEMWDWEAHR